jgi:hypothetical protein
MKKEQKKKRKAKLEEKKTIDGVKVEKKEGIKEEPIKKENIVEKNNWILGTILTILIFLILSVFIVYFIIESKKSFEYNGVEFKIIQEGELTFYNVQVPIYSEKTEEKLRDYNFYLRTDPRELKEMEFDDSFTLMKMMVINYSANLDCSGYGLIALTNLIELHELIGIKVFIDKNETCDSEGRYTYLYIKKSDENRIEKIGKNCYTLYVNDCDIFPTTERVMIETFAKIKQDDIRVFSSDELQSI